MCDKGVNVIGFEQSYQDVIKLIHYKVNQRVGNGVLYNKEEAISNANLEFVKAYHSYQPDKAEFSTHVGYRVGMGIICELKKLSKHPRPLTFSELDEIGQSQVEQKLSIQSRKTENGLPEWVDYLSEDAKTIIQITLDPPKDVSLLVAEKGNNNFLRTFRACIKEYLGYIGWGKSRITNAFEEIEEAMSK